MALATGKIIRLQDFQDIPESITVDETTRATLKWFVFSALEAEINLEDTKEVLAYCNYLVISLIKTKNFIEFLEKNELQVTDILNKLN